MLGIVLVHDYLIKGESQMRNIAKLLCILALLLCMEQSYAGVESLYGKWLNERLRSERLSIGKNGDTTELKIYDRKKISERHPAKYENGILVCYGGVGSLTVYLDKKSGRLILSNFSGSLSYRRITAALSKQLAKEDATYYNAETKRENARRAEEQRKEAQQQKQRAEAELSSNRMWLMDAIDRNNIEKVKSLWSSHPELRNVTGSRGCYITRAAEAKSVELVKYFIDEGCDPNEVDESNSRALDYVWQMVKGLEGERGSVTYNTFRTERERTERDIKILKSIESLLTANNSNNDSPNSPSPSPSNYSGEMIRIPAGSFLMGGKEYEFDGTEKEKPPYSVYLSEYLIGKFEVTRGEYKKFIEAGGYSEPKYWSKAGWDWRLQRRQTKPEYWEAKQHIIMTDLIQTDDHPVIGVNYYEAEAFCNWAGGHLPSSAQWEKAASWNSDHTNAFPWGDTWDEEKCNNRYDHKTAGGAFDASLPAIVGSYQDDKSPYGCMDMAGNVSEWCLDVYVDDYFADKPSGGWVDPVKLKASARDSNFGLAEYRVTRGLAWDSIVNEKHIECADMRGWLDIERSNFNLGFRIVQDKLKIETPESSKSYRLKY